MTEVAPALSSLEAELAKLRQREAAHDAALRTASARTKAEPACDMRAREHLDCAERLAQVARQREAAEEKLLAARRLVAD